MGENESPAINGELLKSELEAQLIELKGRVEAIRNRYHRGDSTLRYTMLQLIFSVLVLILTVYLMVAPYFGRGVQLPFFLTLTVSFLVLLSAYWAYSNAIRLRLYLVKREQLKEAVIRAEYVSEQVEKKLQISGAQTSSPVTAHESAVLSTHPAKE